MSSHFLFAKFREAKLWLIYQTLSGSICHLHITNGYLGGVYTNVLYIKKYITLYSI